MQTRTFVYRLKEKLVRNMGVFPSLPKLSEIISLELEILSRKHAVLAHQWKVFRVQCVLMEACLCNVIKTARGGSGGDWQSKN